MGNSPWKDLCSLLVLTFVCIVSSPADGQTSGLAYRLTLPSLGMPGTTLEVLHTADNSTSLALTGYTLSVCFDPAVHTAAAVIEGDDLLAATGGSVFFFSPEITLDAIGVGVVLSGVGGDTIPVGVGLELTRLQFTAVAGTVGAPASVDYCDFTSPVPPAVAYSNQFLSGGVSFAPELLIGDPPDPNPAMIRGDGNGDAVVNIADPVHTLDYLFSSGSPGPCHDSMDANDDGAVDVADAVHEIQFLFGGGPAPASPFPDCGFDLTVDSLPCMSAGGGC
jgi:hypothetical protein